MATPQTNKSSDSTSTRYPTADKEVTKPKSAQTPGMNDEDSEMSADSDIDADEIEMGAREADTDESEDDEVEGDRGDASLVRNGDDFGSSRANKIKKQ